MKCEIYPLNENNLVWLYVLPAMSVFNKITAPKNVMQYQKKRLNVFACNRSRRSQQR